MFSGVLRSRKLFSRQISRKLWFPRLSRKSCPYQYSNLPFKTWALCSGHGRKDYRDFNVLQFVAEVAKNWFRPGAAKKIAWCSSRSGYPNIGGYGSSTLRIACWTCMSPGTVGDFFTDPIGWTGGYELKGLFTKFKWGVHQTFSGLPCEFLSFFRALWPPRSII